MVRADEVPAASPADIHVEVMVGAAPREVHVVRLSLPAGSSPAPWPVGMSDAEPARLVSVMA